MVIPVITALGSVLAYSGYQDGRAVDPEFDLEIRPESGKSITVQLLESKRG